MKVSKKNPGLERKGVYQIDEVLPFVPREKEKPSLRDYDGDLIRMTSDRYRLFLNQGVKCVQCGLAGSFFAKEKQHSDSRYHFNLYALDADNEEVLMTKDHIQPKSKGGANHLTNYQPMCFLCNQQKGNEVYGQEK